MSVTADISGVAADISGVVADAKTVIADISGAVADVKAGDISGATADISNAVAIVESKSCWNCKSKATLKASAAKPTLKSPILKTSAGWCGIITVKTITDISGAAVADISGAKLSVKKTWAQWLLRK